MMEFGTKPKYEVGTVVYTWNRNKGKPQAYKIVEVVTCNHSKSEGSYTVIEYALNGIYDHITEEALNGKYFASKTGMIKSVIDKIVEIEAEGA